MPVPLLLGEGEGDLSRMRTGLEGVDRVLGGGLLRGSVVLLAGEPGIGKSTLLLHVAANLAKQGRACLLASGEESREQVAGRARRIGLSDEAVSFVPGRDLGAVMNAARASAPAVLVVDSIQAVRDPDQASLPGSTAQVRRCTDALVGLAKEIGTAVVLAGQVTKMGDVAGPRTLEHAVDVVCSFDGDPRTGLRVLVGGKNRFGPEGELAWFEMGPRGLEEADPASVLAPGHGEPGSAVALMSAGRRALAVEVQALVAPAEGPPRRHVSGLDRRRFELVAAMVERAGHLGPRRAEVYGATSGGLRVEDPGCDLAVAAALASAARGVGPPPGTGFVGELSLTGSVRPPPGMAARMSAAAAAGLQVVFAPPGGPDVPGIRVERVRSLREALRWAGKAGNR